MNNETELDIALKITEQEKMIEGYIIECESLKDLNNIKEKINKLYPDMPGYLNKMYSPKNETDWWSHKNNNNYINFSPHEGIDGDTRYCRKEWYNEQKEFQYHQHITAKEFLKIPDNKLLPPHL